MTDATQADQPIFDNRPTGTVPMVLGWICAGLAVVALAASFSSNISYTDAAMASIYESGPRYDAIMAEQIARKMMFRLAAGTLFGTFLLLWSVGYIVNAISYLPARSLPPR